MRISSSLVYNTGLSTINAQQSDLLHLFQQIGSGQKMTTPADDPLAASQAINVAQSQALNTRHAANRAVASQDLGTEENALGSLTLLLQDVRTRLVEAGNGTLSDADRQMLAGVFESARDAALGIANSTDGGGQYLFSGSRGSAPAFDASGAYRGDARQRLIQADQTRRIAGGDTGADVFERAQPGTLVYATRAADGNAGTGVVAAPYVTDRSAAGGNPDSDYAFEVTFVDASTYTVSVTDAGGAAVGVPRTFTLTDGATELDLGFGTRTAFSGTAAPGDQFEVHSLKTERLNLFQTFDDLIAALKAPSQGDGAAGARLRNALNTGMQRLETHYDNLLTVRASVGTRMNELAALDDTGAQHGLGYAKALSGLEDLDYYDATTKLSLRKMALQGATAAFQTIQGLSLFNLGKS